MFVAAVSAGLKSAAVDIMKVADVYVPKDTETLRNSRMIGDVETTGDALHLTIGFGYGGALNPKTGEHPSQYALPVHEILDARHAPPTQAKYLETAVIEYEPLFGPTISAWITRGERVGFWDDPMGELALSMQNIVPGAGPGVAY